MTNKTLDNKGDTSLVSTLHRGIKQCNKVCGPALAKKQALLGEYANGWYTDAPTSRRPMNMVARAVKLLLPLLASKNPNAMTRARVIELAPAAEVMRLTLNHLSSKIRLGATMREVVLNALFYMGIIKKGICAGGPRIKDAYGAYHDAGQLFCDSVHPEDYKFDVSARKKEELDWEMNWFYVPAEYILDSGLYDNYDKLNIAYGKDIKNSAEEIAKGNIKHFDSLKPYVKLGEVYIPSENVLITIPADGEGTEPIRTVDYTGPVGGPFDLLSFDIFPESIVPIAPLFVNLDLHYFINIMTRKMARQANREKKILAYQGNAAGDAKRVTDAVDGGSVRVDDVNAMKEIEYGGTADASYKWVEWLNAKWSEQLGNANLIGGLKADAGTLGQEQMMQANASASIDDMVGQVHTLLKGIFETFAFHIFTDPFLDITVSKRKAGLYNIPVHLTADTREGDFWSYNFDVEPYSMQRMNPQMRMRRIMEIVQGIIVPTLPLAMQQGVQLNIPALVKSISRDMDLTDSEIEEFYNVATKVQSSLGPYQPSKGVSDSMGASGASKDLNSIQQQNRAGGKPSPPNTNNV